MWSSAILRSWSAFRHAVADRHGHLSVAVNNAGMAAPGLVADLDEAAWQEIVATNLTGLWLSMKHEIAHLRRSGGGATAWPPSAARDRHTGFDRGSTGEGVPT
jgi:NAD(P)-dependent dehydrogenase (short-subunit alcohol dehydrogenase family)